MDITVTALVTRRDMFSYLMNSAYRSVSGILLTVFGCFCIAVVFITWGEVELTVSLLLLLLGFMYTIYRPLHLWMLAGRRVKKTTYAEPITYIFNEQGITSRQGEQEASSDWEALWKARIWGNILVIFVSVNVGIILPEEAIGENREALLNLIADHLPTNFKKSK